MIRRRCDQRCREARRARCDCICGGRYHGTQGAAQLSTDLGLESLDALVLREEDLARLGIPAARPRPLKTGRRRRLPDPRQLALPFDEVPPMRDDSESAAAPELETLPEDMVAVRFVGQCLNGSERDGGTRIHLARAKDGQPGVFHRTVCGTKPGRLSHGFEVVERDATCARCRQRAKL